MIHHNHTFQAIDGLTLFAQSWIPDDTPKAEIIMVHGIGEHSGRYYQWASRFCEQGIAFHAIDHRGHGLSKGKPGVINHLNDYLNDLESFIKYLTPYYHATPRFVYGHSMGGNLALNYLMHFHPQVTGAIITSPWLGLVHPPSPWMTHLVRRIDRLVPHVTISNGITPKQLTHDPVEQERAEQDQLNHTRISVRLFNRLSAAAEYLMSHPQSFTMPLLMLHGQDDSITSWEATQQFARQAPKATFKAYTNALHELHNETIRDEVFMDIHNWIEMQIAGK
ncbi:MAG: lysophospholipase [Marinilabiliaceae bacterium]|nr:lysophospholipase [Marinilabiliaceae bacterium]